MKGFGIKRVSPEEKLSTSCCKHATAEFSLSDNPKQTLLQNASARVLQPSVWPSMPGARFAQLVKKYVVKQKPGTCHRFENHD